MVFVGVFISVLIIGFVLWRAQAAANQIQPAMAAILCAVALVTPLAFGQIGAGFRATLPGVSLETLVEQAQQAAQSTSIDRKEVEALKTQIDGTATELENLEGRYRRVVGDSTSLTLLMWLSRGMFGAMPPATDAEMNRLVNNIMAEAYPDPQERAAVWKRTQELGAFAQHK